MLAVAFIGLAFAPAWQRGLVALPLVAPRAGPAFATLAASGWGRPLGNMEKLLDARRSWSGALTTAHVSGSMVRGPPPTEPELLAALEWTVRRHPLLRAVVVGRGKHDVPGARPYALHADYLGKAIEGKPELFRPDPDPDPPRFEPSSSAPAELARRGLSVDAPSSDVEADLLSLFDAALDETRFDRAGDGPLWSLRLIPPASAGGRSGLLWAANHAISDQLSHNQVCKPSSHVFFGLTPRP